MTDATAIPTRIADLTCTPLDKPLPASAAIRTRILAKHDVEVPVAAFQSSI